MHESHHAFVVCSNLFSVVSMEYAPCFVFLLAGVAEATAEAAVTRTNPQGGPVPLKNTAKYISNSTQQDKHHQTNRIHKLPIECYHV